jgi:CRP-like cAMP-binding protein
MMNLPLFSNIPHQDCEKIISTARKKTVPQGQTLFGQNGRARQVLLLISGCAKVMHLNSNGDETITRLSIPGDIHGVSRDCPSEDSGASVVALQLSGALVWDALVFESLLERFSALSCNVSQILDQQLQNMEKRFSELATEHVPSRLLKEIIRLVDRVGHRANGHIEINFSCEELAQMTGTTLFTVSRLLSAWERQGALITRKRVVEVHDPQALINLAGRRSDNSEGRWS